MPTVPTYNRPTETPASPKYAPLSAAGGTPEAFGATQGEAVARLGGQVSQIGDVFERHAQQYQLQENEAEANEATTNYLIKQSEITERFKQLQGKDPAAAMKQYTDDLKGLRASLREGLSNPEVQRMFDRETTRQFGYAVMNGSSYAATQQRAYFTGQQRAKLDNMERAAVDATSTDVLMPQLNALRTEVLNSNDFKGKSPEEAEAEIRKRQGNVWGPWLKNLAQTDPGAARSILNKNRKDIDGLVVQNLEDYIDKQTTAVESVRLGNGVVSDGVVNTKQQKVDYAISFLTTKWGKAAAAGLIGGMDFGESGLDTSARNPGDGRDGSDSIGIAQWNSVRAQNLQRKAKEWGTDWRDFKTQVRFIDWELENTHKAVGDKLRGIADVTQAARIATGEYEVAGGTIGGNPDRVPNLGARIEGARQYYGRVAAPITSMGTSPGQREAYVQSAQKAAEEYADANGLNPRMRQDLVKATIGQVESLYSKQMQVLADGDRANRNTLVGAVNGDENGAGGATSFAELRQNPQAWEAYGRAPEETKARIQKMMERNRSAKFSPTVPTAETVANEQRLAQMRVDRPDEYQKIDFTDPEQAGPLTRQGLSRAMQAQEKIGSGQQKADEAATQKRRVDEAIKVLSANRMLDITGLRDEDKNRPGDLMPQLRGAMIQELDRFNVERNGEHPSEDEIKKMGQKILRETVTTPWYTLGGLFGESKTKVFTPEAAAPKIVPYSQIPVEERLKLGEALRRNGIEPSIQNQRLYYQKKLDRSGESAQ